MLNSSPFIFPLIYYAYSFNKKSPLSNTPSKITLIAFDSNNETNPNVFNRVCVVRTDGSRKSPNGKDVLYNW